MLKRTPIVVCFLLLTFAAAMAQEAKPLYEFDFKEKESSIEILQDRYVWFRVKDGYHLFDALSGEAVWAHKELPEFDGRFTLNWEEDFLLYSTKAGLSRLDISTGNIAWSVELSSMKFKDVADYWETDAGVLFYGGKKLVLVDVEQGTEVWSVDIEANGDLVKAGKSWIVEADGRLLVLAEQGPVLLDVGSGQTVWSATGKFSKKTEEAVTILDHRAILYYDKSLSIVDLALGKSLATIEGKIEESSSFEVFEHDGQVYLLFGFNKKLMAFDGNSGDLLWETAEGEVAGSVRWVQASVDPGKVLIIDLRVDKLGGDAGTWLTMHSVDLATGAIGWSQLIGYSQLASTMVNKAFSAGEGSTWGTLDISIWFEEPIVDGDNLVFLIKGLITGDPLTKERDESQGFLSINTRTGKVNYLARFEAVHPKKPSAHATLGAGLLRDPNDAYPAPLQVGSILVGVGHEGLTGVDQATGEIRWTADIGKGAATALTLLDDDVVLAKVGGMFADVTLEAGGKMKYAGKELKPYGFIAIQAATGKVLWTNVDFQLDPTQAMAANIVDDVLYGCDGDRLYAMALADGQFRWVFDIKKQAGKIYGDKAWVVDVEKSTSSGFGTETTTTTWSNPRRVLQAVDRGDHFIIFGEKQILRIDNDGDLAWSYAWQYTNNYVKVDWEPQFAGGNIVYAIDGFFGIDEETGQVQWADKEIKGDFYMVGEGIVLVRDKKKVSGFSLN